MDYEKLRAELERDEGMRYTAYRDSLGYWTIGIGHLLSTSSKLTKPPLQSVSRSEALKMLEEDIKEAEKTLDNVIPQWRSFDEVRQRALANLAFNLGYKLNQFRRFKAALEFEDWEDAAGHLQDSLWYRQVRSRGPRIVKMIRTGEV